jgi:uncharacterized protein involved in exopolysaccharide biosynthesis
LEKRYKRYWTQEKLENTITAKTDGIPTADNITISPKSSYVISPTVTAKAENNNEPQSSETNDNEVQKTIIDNNNDDIGDKIREKLKNLREKINERVKETLEQQGIESDLPSSPNWDFNRKS